MSIEREFYAIAPTQFAHDGSLDAEATSENVERATEAGVSRFLLAGAYGEFQSLEDDERLRLVEAVRARSPEVVIMTGAVHPSTDATLELANRLFEVGADEVMVGPPSMSETMESDLLRHFDHLGSRANGALVVYNNPIFGHDLSVDLISHLADSPAFIAIKQGTGSAARLLDSVAAAHAGSQRLRVLAASDVTAIVTLASGVDGLSSTNFWAFPEPLLTIARTAATVEHDLALSVHRALAPFFEMVRALGQPRAIKAAMAMRGFAGTPTVRLPYQPLSEVENRSLQEVVTAVDSALADIEPSLGARAS